jgi:hypothetical protein
MVGTRRIELLTPTVSMWCSPTELRARTVDLPLFSRFRLYNSSEGTTRGRPFGDARPRRGLNLTERLDMSNLGVCVGLIVASLIITAQSALANEVHLQCDPTSITSNQGVHNVSDALRLIVNSSGGYVIMQHFGEDRRLDRRYQATVSSSTISWAGKFVLRRGTLIEELPTIILHWDCR